MSSSPNVPGHLGSQQNSDPASAFNSLAFLIRQAITKLETATVVRVMAVTNDGGVSPVGKVDILPLVAQIDGSGVAQEHGVIYGCPYHRIQGGANAVILDPQVGDIGIAVFASRDISSVIETKDASLPGSRRIMSMADGLYIGGVLNSAPEQYVQFSSAGITLNSPTAVMLEAPSVEISSPSVQIDCATFVVNASGSVALNAPEVNASAAVNVGATLTAEDIVQGGKSIGSAHTHNLTGGGHTLEVT